MASTTGENEKQLLAAVVRERIIGNKNSVSYKELQEEKIPTFLKNYLKNTVQKIVHTEEPVQFKHSKRFNFEDQKIGYLRQSLISAFEDATIFHREELADIINKTISLQFDLLIRPKSTLLKIFYSNKSDRIQNDILQILEGLEDNRIFIKTLIKKVKAFDQFHIVKQDFKKLLHTVEDEMYKSHFQTTFISELKNVADFLGMIQGNENEMVNMDFVRLLLAERNLEKFLPSLENYNNDRLNIRELTDIFNNWDNSGNGNGNGSHSVKDEIDNFLMLPINDDGQKQESEKFVEQDTFSEKNINKVTRVTNFNEDPTNFKITREDIERQPEGPIESLAVIIDEKSEKFLTKRIFNNHNHEYSKFKDQLENIDNWKKAKEIIDIELNKRGVKPFSKEALKLGDLVFARYFPESHP